MSRRREAFPDGLPLPCFDFADAIDAVKEGRADCAIIPIENSLHGRVADIHFLLPESGLVITGEHFLPIRHALMGARPARRRARGDEPSAGAGPVPPLAARARDRAGRLSRHRGRGGGGRGAGRSRGRRARPAGRGGDSTGSTCSPTDIADAEHNTTRFVTLARGGRPPVGDGPWMTTLIFEVKNVPAALYKAMGGFATNGVNMTKLESYQRGGSFAATEFYADIVGRPGDAAVDRALEELGFHSKWVRLLGTYRQARARG